MTGPEQVLIEDWCQQFPSHSIGSLAFGPDGDLYVSGGDGASFDFADYGQRQTRSTPAATRRRPWAGCMTPPTAEGGALRGQDLRTTRRSRRLDGTILRVIPTRATALPGNPLRGERRRRTRAASSPTGSATRSASTFRPGTNELWVGDVGWNDVGGDRPRPRPDRRRGRELRLALLRGRRPRQAGYDAADLSHLREPLHRRELGRTAPYFAYNHGDSRRRGRRVRDQRVVDLGDGVRTRGGTFPTEYDGALFFADY